MLPVNSKILPNPQDVAAQACLIIIAEAAAAIRERKLFRIVLAGGSTPHRTYEMLARMATDWSAWEIFWSDERCLPADHAGRNSRMAHDVWLSRVAIPARLIHPIPAERGAKLAAAEYAANIRDKLPFDLVLLGMGIDGHTASLFATSGDHIAPVLAVHNAPKPPAERVSLNFQTLRTCRHQLVLVTGAEKSPAMFAWQQGANLPIACAARNDAFLLVDAEAGQSTNFMASQL
ncbi:MAG: 6-phosphogluconolactonase [Betaproteobacteria bacterium HGW-Betaproteobacteria-7]|jgi:6-phosphogluconolactonase|nr:MAG: 6-phosphogluconolactonase [Betaproteobacteria bacterium HGW-Betaproteobacteria-7]